MLKMEKWSQRLNAASNLAIGEQLSFWPVTNVLCDLGMVNTPFWARIPASVK